MGMGEEKMMETHGLLSLFAKQRFSEGFFICRVHKFKFLRYEIDLIWLEEACAFRFGLKLVYFILNLLWSILKNQYPHIG